MAMDVREKIVELLTEFYGIAPMYLGADINALIEYLIAKGVTVQETARRCVDGKPVTNADRIKAMSDEELAEFLTHINPTNCKDCAFSHGWRCQPDRDDYSDFDKCKEGRKRWLQQPAEDIDDGT